MLLCKKYNTDFVPCQELISFWEFSFVKIFVFGYKNNTAFGGVFCSLLSVEFVKFT
jgi:hypothetical protein